MYMTLTCVALDICSRVWTGCVTDVHVMQSKDDDKNKKKDEKKDGNKDKVCLHECIHTTLCVYVYGWPLYQRNPDQKYLLWLLFAIDVCTRRHVLVCTEAAHLLGSAQTLCFCPQRMGRMQMHVSILSLVLREHQIPAVVTETNLCILRHITNSFFVVHWYILIPMCMHSYVSIPRMRS